MEIREKGNLLVLYFSKKEDIVAALQSVVREYLIIDAKITGYGYFDRIEYGILAEADPIFFTKHLCEKLVTAPMLFGIIENREVTLMLNAADQENEKHSGKLFSAIVALESVIILDILKTD